MVFFELSVRFLSEPIHVLLDAFTVYWTSIPSIEITICLKHVFKLQTLDRFH
jgi:hypothetical protein